MLIIIISQYDTGNKSVCFALNKSKNLYAVIYFSLRVQILLFIPFHFIKLFAFALLLLFALSTYSSLLSC